MSSTKSAPKHSPALDPTARTIEETTEAIAAQEAAFEAAEAADPFTAGGMAVEAAAQAEYIATSLDPSHRDALSREERRSVGRNVFRLAWPAIAENALQTLLGIVDTIVVARLGTAALSGVGASQQLIWVLTTALIAISMGTTVVIAHFTGAKQHERANAVLKQALMIAALFGIALIPVAFLSHPLLGALGLTPAAVNAGATYLEITLAAGILIVLMFVASAALRGAGDTRTPMYVTAFINVINAILAVELVFGGVKAGEIFGGFLPFGMTLPGLDWMPAMGVAGSAWAAVIARGVGFGLLFGCFFLPRSYLKLAGPNSGSWRPNLELVRRIFKIGIPTAVEQLLMSLGILVYSFLVIGMGEVIFATSRLALNIVFLSQMPGFGFAMAVTTLVGQSLGAKQPARAWLGARLSTRSALLWMSVMGAAFFFIPEPILRVFTDDPRLIKLGSQCLLVIAFSQPPLAFAFVLAGALRGAGDVRYPMVVTTVAVWLVRLPVGMFLGLSSVCIPFTSVCIPGLGLGLVGVYGALIVEASFRALLMYVRFRGGKWQTMKV